MPVRDSVGCHLKYRQIVSAMKKDAFHEWEVTHSHDYNPRKNKHEWKEKLPNIRLTKSKEVETDTGNQTEGIYNDNLYIPGNGKACESTSTDVISLPNISNKEECMMDAFDMGDKLTTRESKIMSRANLWTHIGDNPWSSKHFPRLHQSEPNKSPAGDDLSFMSHINTEDYHDFINRFLAPVEEANRSMDVAIFGQGIQFDTRPISRDDTGCYYSG